MDLAPDKVDIKIFCILYQGLVPWIILLFFSHLKLATL
jgi:hypothetical protein